MQSVAKQVSTAIRLLVAGLLIVGCGNHDRFVHNPPLADRISRVMEGKTTRQKVIQYLGQPDLVVDGTSMTIQRDGTLGLFREALHHKKRGMEQTFARTSFIGPKTKPTVQFDPVVWEELQPHSSISDRFIAFVYWEVDITYQQVQSPIGMRGWHNVLRNKLLVLIDKETDVVELISYREEFKAK
jgi:hypothetical protein